MRVDADGLGGRRVDGDGEAGRLALVDGGLVRRDSDVRAVHAPLVAELLPSEHAVVVAIALQGRVLAGRAEVPWIVPRPVAVQVYVPSRVDAGIAPRFCIWAVERAVAPYPADRVL